MENLIQWEAVVLRNFGLSNNRLLIITFKKLLGSHAVMSSVVIYHRTRMYGRLNAKTMDKAVF